MNVRKDANKMQKKYLIILVLIPVLVSFSIAIFWPNVFKLKYPLFEITIGILGLAGITISTFFLFRSRLYFALGVIFAIVSNMIPFFIWDRFPYFSKVGFPLTLFLAVTFLCIAAYRSLREFIDRFRK
jgi:hypothetical protein